MLSVIFDLSFGFSEEVESFHFVAQSLHKEQNPLELLAKMCLKNIFQIANKIQPKSYNK